MKLVVFGLAISSSWGNGHATLWRALCRAMAARGHTIAFFERDVPYYAAHRDLFALESGSLHIYTSWDDVRLLAARELQDADAGIVTSFCPDANAAGDLLLDSRVAVKAFYDLDAPITLERLQRGEAVAYLGPRGLADYDVAISYAGGEVLQELQSRLRARRAVPLYGSVDPLRHQPVRPVDRYLADLSFLGTFSSDRQDAIERLFLEPARRLPASRFVLGGSQYPVDFPWSPNVYYMQHVAPEEHPAFFCSSRLTLNVTRRAMAMTGYCPSGRLFEAAACGAPIASDKWPGLEEFFEPDDQILVASSSEDMAAALERSDAELKAIARRARERTLEEHTAAARARELEHILDPHRRDDRVGHHSRSRRRHAHPAARFLEGAPAGGEPPGRTH